MPKARIWRRGFKSIAKKIKFKIGGRKSTKGAFQMTTSELTSTLNSVRKRDRNKLRRALENRGIALPS